MTFLQRKYLKDINFEISNDIFILAIIMGKTEYRTYSSEKFSEIRGVLSFLIRDSQQHFTICKVWAKKDLIEQYNIEFTIGDIIKINSPRITPIQNDSKKFDPKVPAPFLITINEGRGFIECCKDEELKSLWNISIKPLNTSLSLADITANGEFSVGQHIDLLVIIGKLKQVRTVKLKTGEIKRCMELIVMDQSSMSGINFTIWHPDWINRGEKIWKPYVTILHLIDVRVNFSVFYNSTVLEFSSNSILIENPKGEEAFKLAEYINSNILMEGGNDLILHNGFNIPDANSITHVMTVKQIYDRINKVSINSEQFTAVLYALTTKIDLDGCSRIVNKRCKICKKNILQSKEKCDSPHCQENISFDNCFDYYYDINIHLTDHTATLIEAKLVGEYAESFLGVKVIDFINLNDCQRSLLKWKFLMERFAAKLLIKKMFTPYILIIEMTKVNLDKSAEEIRLY